MIDGWLSKIEKKDDNIKRETHTSQSFLAGDAPYLVPGQSLEKSSIRNEFTLSHAKRSFALFVPPLSNGTSRATSRPREKKPALKKALNRVESFKLSWWLYRG